MRPRGNLTQRRETVIQVNWQAQVLNVRRLVFRRGNEFSFDAVLDRLAAGFYLEVADGRAEPRSGDFWIGCHPRAGWGDADPARIGWASLVEVPLAVGVLNLAAAQNEWPAETVADAPALVGAFG
jgi:hypothetical protein